VGWGGKLGERIVESFVFGVGGGSESDDGSDIGERKREREREKSNPFLVGKAGEVCMFA